MSTVKSFEILFNNETATYNEGDLLKGCLRIIVLGKVKYHAVKLELYGVALVQWDRKDDNAHPVNFDPYAINKGCNREQYFRTTLTLLDKDKLPAGSTDSVFDEGEYRVAFEFQLPRELPSSFEGKFGQIRYLAKATIEKELISACGDMLMKDVVTKCGFTIVNGLDLNFIQEAAVKIKIIKHKKIGAIWCFGGGSMDIEFNVSRSGYVPGEAIEITSVVKNRCRLSLLYCKAALRMIVNYKSTRRRRKEIRTLVVVKQGETPAGKDKRRISRLFIPPLPPTGISRSRLIDITYELRLSSMLEGATDPIVFTKDIYIGTVQMNKQHMNSCLSGMFNVNSSIAQYNRDVTSSREELTPRVEASAPAMSAVFYRCCSRSSDVSFSSHMPSCSGISQQIRPSCYNAAPPETSERQLYRRPARDFDTQSYQSIYPQFNNIPPEEAPPLYEQGVFPAVSIRDRCDGDVESLRGEFMYLPNYPYFEAVLERRSAMARVPPAYSSPDHSTVYLNHKAAGH